MLWKIVTPLIILALGATACNHSDENSDTIPSTSPETIPYTIPNVISGAVDISFLSTRGLGCVVNTHAELWCWIDNRGDGEAGDFTKPKKSPIKNAAGLTIGCTAVPNEGGGDLWCWDVDEDNLVLDVENPQKSPVDKIDNIAQGSSINAGCVTANGGNLWCWNAEATGIEFDAPKRVALDNIYVVNSCAINLDGNFWCWEGFTDFLDPKKSPIETAHQVTGTHSRGCVNTRGGELWCWDNDVAGSEFDNPKKFPINLVFKVAAHSFLGNGCAATNSRELWCWGSGSNSEFDNPEKSPIKGVRSLALLSTNKSGCAATDRGELWCWFDDYNEPEKSPVEHAGNVTGLAAVGDGCVRAWIGDVWCWERGSFDDPEQSPL